MTKECTKCKTEYPEDQFPFKNKAKGIRHGICLTCGREYRKAHFEKNKQYYRDKQKVRGERIKKEAKQIVLEYLKNHPCVDCGESDPVVLQFDHVRGIKKCAVSKLVSSSYLPDVIIEEIEKCDVRCANCHSRKTAKEYGWYTLH